MMNDDLLAQLSTRVPLADRGQLVRIVERIAATMATWASPASHAALEPLVGEAPLRDPSSSGASLRSIGLEALYDAVADETSTSRGTARELTQTVALMMAHALGPQARARLAHDLPREWAPLLEDPHDVPADHRPAPPVDRGHTLAAGRPGATTSLSDAAFAGGQSDSVASSDDPGGARKLSGGEGPTPRGRDLATGRR
jgi:hypothetical protein